METINARRHVAEILLKLPKTPTVFTIEMYDGAKYEATLSDERHQWYGFENLRNTTLTNSNGHIPIDLFNVKDIY